MKTPKYFKTEDLVSKRVFDRLGDLALQFIPERSIECLDTLRKEVGVNMTINNWYKKSGNNDNNGLICFEDLDYKRVVEHSHFNGFNKQWFGMRFYIVFSGKTAEDAITDIEAKRSSIPYLGLVQKAGSSRLNQNTILVEILANELPNLPEETK